MSDVAALSRPEVDARDSVVLRLVGQESGSE